MNIFACSSDPVVAAKALDDKRLIKSILETAQILSSALFNLGYWKSSLYKPTHLNHPCVRWAQESRGNFDWLVLYGLACNVEYKYRFGNRESSSGAPAKEHQSSFVVLNCAEVFTKECKLDRKGMTPFRNVTDVYDDTPVMKKYQRYLARKWQVSEPRWTRRPRPDWYKIREVA